MTPIFKQMELAAHERVSYHYDEETGLRAIVAIHSTKLGPALGGTRRWIYANEEVAIKDVLRLSPTTLYPLFTLTLP